MHDMPGDYCWVQEGAWVRAHILLDMHRRVDSKEKGKQFFGCLDCYRYAQFAEKTLRRLP